MCFLNVFRVLYGNVVYLSFCGFFKFTIYFQLFVLFFLIQLMNK